MAVRSAALALGASGLVLLIAGCATPTPIPPGASDAEAREVATQYVADYWKFLPHPQRRELPDIDIVAFTTTSSWASTQVSCLTAAGLPAREVNGGFAVDGNGALSPDESVDAQLTCMAQYPVDPRTRGYLSAEQLLYVYDYFVQRLAPCLRGLGYHVLPPPDRLAYVGTVRTGFSWSPYRLDRGLLKATASRWELINAKCPPLPDYPFANFQPPGPG